MAHCFDFNVYKMFVLLGKFCVGARYFKILHYFENYVTLKLCYFLKVSFVTFEKLFYPEKLRCILKLRFLEKLCYFEKLRYLKTVLLLKILVTVVKLRCFENYVTLKILRWGALLFWKVTYLKNICITL